MNTSIKYLISGATRALLFILLTIGFFPTGFSQQIIIPDHLVKNRFNNFMVNLEDRMNEKGAFEKSRNTYVLNSSFYNNQVTVVDDFNKNEAYITWDNYREMVNNMSDSCLISYAHYNLTINKRKVQPAFDIITAQVRRITERDCGTGKDSLVNNFVITAIYYKYQTDDTKPKFRILKIDNANTSLKPDAWYRDQIPDELFVQLTPDYSMPAIKQSDVSINTTSKIGFHGLVGVNYLISGWDKHLIMLKAGLGFSKVSTEYSLDNYETSFYTTDKDGDEYIREVYGKSLTQTLDYSTLDIPLMISWRYLLNKKWQISASTGIKASYIFQQNYKINNGEFEYRGLYENLYGETFYFQDLPSYGFTSYDSKTQSNNPQINDLLLSWQSEVYVRYQISNTTGIFFGPNFSMGLNKMTDPVASDFVLSEQGGFTKPLLNLTEQAKMNTIGFTAGISISINNINRSFIPGIRFKKQQKGIQKQNKEVFVDALFAPAASSDNTPLNESSEIPNSEHTVQIDYTPNDCCPGFEPTDKIKNYPYSVKGANGQQSKTGTLGKHGKIQTAASSGNEEALFYKQFGYNITTDQSEKYTGLQDSLFYMPPGHAANKLELLPIPPLNVIVYNVNKDAKSLAENREDVYKKYFRIMELLDQENENESCYTYIWNDDHAEDDRGELINNCLRCSIDKARTKEKIAFLTQKYDPIDFVNDLKVLLGEQLAPGRRKVKLHFFIADIAYVRELLQRGLKNLLRAIDPDQEMIVEINIYFDAKEVNRLEYISGIEEPVPYYDEMIIWHEKGSTSIQLKNIVLHPIN